MATSVAVVTNHGKPCHCPDDNTVDHSLHASAGVAFSPRPVKNSAFTLGEWIGWTFFVERNGSVEVEELFIMPAFRRRGYATGLVNMIGEHARQHGATLTVWISHADTAPNNMRIVEKLADRLGLKLSVSPVRWASYVVRSTATANGASSPHVVRPLAGHVVGGV